ncbi:MAG: exonuclease [Nitrosopumilus sp. D6]|nr:MAG: exonuclease [Nitrosopumilus sp. D6]
MTKNGILCESGSRRVLLDPKSADAKSVNFVSHAHSDHLPSGGAGIMLASHETRQIAGIRGLQMKDHADSLAGFEMIDSGHILGSRGLLFDDIFYTGDICTRDRGFLRGARVPKCRILITECTFGMPEFVFPGIAETKRQVNSLISDLYSKGIPVILMGYQLGKAQTITQLFGHWTPLYMHDSVMKMNALHGRLGVNLADGIGHTEAKKRGLLEKKPWVMVAPLMSAKNAFVQEMKSKYGAVTVGFTGWAKSPRVSFGRKTDYSIPLSDHCDFGELVNMVRQTGAEQVYTMHGFATEFADYLNNMGIMAQSLLEGAPDRYPSLRTGRTGSLPQGTSRHF